MSAGKIDPVTLSVRRVQAGIITLADARTLVAEVESLGQQLARALAAGEQAVEQRNKLADELRRLRAAQGGAS